MYIGHVFTISVLRPFHLAECIFDSVTPCLPTKLQSSFSAHRAYMFLANNTTFHYGSEQKKHNENSSLIIHFPTCSNWVSERSSEWVRVAERASESNKWTNKRPSTFVWILDCSGLSCNYSFLCKPRPFHLAKSIKQGRHYEKTPSQVKSRWKTGVTEEKMENNGKVSLNLLFLPLFLLLFLLLLVLF